MGKLKPVTPGELLLEEFLIPMWISRYRLAKGIGVPAQRIRGDRGGQAHHHGRYRPTPVPVLRPVQRLLAAGPGGLRHGSGGRGPVARYAGEDQAVGEHYSIAQ